MNRQPLLDKPVFQDQIEGVWIGLFNLDEFSLESMYVIPLTSTENQVALSFKTPQLQERFTKRKKLIRYLLSNHLDIQPHTLLIQKTRHGKPYLANPQRALHFSTSHCDHMFLVGMSSQPLGVDLEKRDDVIDYMTISQQFFTEKECQQIKASIDPIESFYKHWTQKEALLKLYGKALKDGFTENKTANFYQIPFPSNNADSFYFGCIALGKSVTKTTTRSAG